MAAYVRLRAPYHLIASGVSGTFGGALPGPWPALRRSPGPGLRCGALRCAAPNRASRAEPRRALPPRRWALGEPLNRLPLPAAPRLPRPTQAPRRPTTVPATAACCRLTARWRRRRRGCRLTRRARVRAPWAAARCGARQGPPAALLHRPRLPVCRAPAPDSLKTVCARMPDPAAALPSPHPPQGSDFYLQNSPWEIDAAVARLDPSAALACGDACQLRWGRAAFAAHLQVGGRGPAGAVAWWRCTGGAPAGDGRRWGCARGRPPRLNALPPIPPAPPHAGRRAPAEATNRRRRWRQRAAHAARAPAGAAAGPGRGGRGARAPRRWWVFGWRQAAGGARLPLMCVAPRPAAPDPSGSPPPLLRPRRVVHRRAAALRRGPGPGPRRGGRPRARALLAAGRVRSVPAGGCVGRRQQWQRHSCRGRRQRQRWGSRHQRGRGRQRRRPRVMGDRRASGGGAGRGGRGPDPG
jgi:hypothetical protein